VTALTVGLAGHEANHRLTSGAMMPAIACASFKQTHQRRILDPSIGLESGQCVSSFAVMRRVGMSPIGERVVWADNRQRNERCLFYSVERSVFQASLPSM
jgi:hypothetical protein